MLPEHGRWAEVAWRELTQVRSEPHSLPLVEDARWLAALALEARNLAVACNTLVQGGLDDPALCTGFVGAGLPSPGTLGVQPKASLLAHRATGHPEIPRSG